MPLTAHLSKLLATLLALVMLAAACGSEATTLIGDTAVATPTAQGAAAEAPTAAPVAPAADPTATTPVEPPAETDAGSDVDGSQVTLQVGEEDATDESTEESAEPSPAVAGEAIVVAQGGAVATTNGFEFSVYSTIATSADPESYLTGNPEPSAENWLIVHVGIETPGLSRWIIQTDEVSLVSPSGLTITSHTRAYDRIGDSKFAALDLPTTHGRSTVERYLVFPTGSEPITDVTGWNLTIADDREIPLVVPLEGSEYVEHYPLSLDVGATAVLDLEGFAGCSNGASYEATVMAATVTVEDDESERVTVGERIFTIDLALTNLLIQDGLFELNCGNVALWPDFGLLVDGRPISTDSLSLLDIEGKATGRLEIPFQIPANATSLELVGADDRTTIAQWDVELQPAFGEPGVALTPFDPARPSPTPPEPHGARPAELTTTDLSAGGASGTFREVAYQVGTSTTTNAHPDGLLEGSPSIDDEGRTWLIVELDIENTITEDWLAFASNVVVIDPAGNPHGTNASYDRTGEKVSANFLLKGIDATTVRYAFETDGLVTDVAGWQLQIEADGLRPLVLPLAGAAPTSDYPLALASGQEVRVQSEPFSGCEAPTLDVTVDNAAVDLEGPDRVLDRRVVRASPETILVRLDVTLVRADADDSLCGSLYQYDEFLLEVDGVLTQSFGYEKDLLETGEVYTIAPTYEIPADAQTVRFIGGRGDVIAEWQLKDAGQVLEDFGAVAKDAGTLITLDETVLFAFGSATLQSSATAPLTRVASLISTEADGDVRVTGHTDSIGDDASNQALSEARAQAVADALIAAGVDADRLIVTGAGESEPVAANTNDDGTDNPAGRAQNRRVEVFFTTG